MRIDATELRCRVVGEGGNLGFTQRARVEYALAGGRINTDAIDNSAGVDTSDHEVNIKILLQRAIATGALAADRRDALPRRHDRRGGRARAGRQRSPGERARDRRGRGPRSRRGARAADGTARADRRASTARSRRCRRAKVLQERHAAGLGLTSPELAVLLAYTKLELQRALVASDVPDDPYLHDRPRRVLPAVAAHRLRRRARVAPAAPRDRGHRRRQRGREPRRDQLPVALVRRDRTRRSRHWRARTSSPATCSTPPTRGLPSTRSTSPFPRRCRTRCSSSCVVWSSDRRAGWCATPSHSPLGPDRRALPARRAGGHRGAPRAAGGIGGRTPPRRPRSRFVEAGVAPDLARRVAASDAALVALPAVALALEHDVDATTVARIQFLLDDRLGLDRLRERIAALPRADRWQTEARAALRDDFYESQHALTAAVITETDAAGTPEARVDAWLAAHDARGRSLPRPRARRGAAPTSPTSPPWPSSAARCETSPRSEPTSHRRSLPHRSVSACGCGQRAARPVQRRMRSAASAARAALEPHAPCTPPPGCADADARNRPAHGGLGPAEARDRPEHRLLRAARWCRRRARRRRGWRCPPPSAGGLQHVAAGDQRAEARARDASISASTRSANVSTSAASHLPVRSPPASPRTCRGTWV